jgi:hypothetical protein
VSDIPNFNDLGQVSFGASINTAGCGAGVWLFDHGQLLPVAVRGQAATAIGTDRTFENFQEIVLNNSGTIAFQAHARLPDVNQPWRSAVWEYQNGALNPIIAGGAVVPLRQGNSTINSYTDPFSYSQPFGRIAVTSKDDVAFTARLEGFPPSGLWKIHGTSVNLIDQATSNNFGDINDFLNNDIVNKPVAPSVNSHGHVAFAMCTTSRYPCYSGGAWINEGNTLTPLALSGETNSLNGHNYTFTGPFGPTAMDDNDDGTFAADYLDSVTGVTQPGIWLFSAGHLRLIGGIVDGLPDEDPAQPNYGISGITVNNRGQVAFEMGVGIWATDSSGVLRLIVRRDEQIDVDNGTGENLQTVDWIRANLNDRGSGRPNGFNDRGESVFQVQDSIYSTGDGVFMSRAVAIPEPSTGMLCGLAIATVAGLRRRGAIRIWLRA